MFRIQVPLLLAAALLVLAVNGAVVLDRSRPTGALTVADGGLDRPPGTSPSPSGTEPDGTGVEDVLSADGPGTAEDERRDVDVPVAVPSSPGEGVELPSELTSAEETDPGQHPGYTTRPVDARTTLDREHYYEGEPVVAAVEVCNDDPKRPARYELAEQEGEFHLIASNHRGEEQVSLFGGQGGPDGEIRELAPGTCIGHRFVWDRTRNGQAVEPGPWEIFAGWRAWQLGGPEAREPARQWIELHDVPRPGDSDPPVDDDRDYAYDVTVDLELDRALYRTGESVAYTIRLCNVTDGDLTWEYAENLDRPVALHLFNPDDTDAHADLRNGYAPARGETVGTERVRLPANDCLSWNGVWKQTRGKFELDGRGDGDPFGPGDVIATVVAEGHCLEYDVRHPDDEVRFTID